jgi:hypothetical protein
MQSNEYFDLYKVFTEAYEEKKRIVLELNIILGDDRCYMS